MATTKITREQIHAMQKNAKHKFVEWVVRHTREQVEDDIICFTEEGDPMTETQIAFRVSRHHLSSTQDIYAELKDHFPDSFVQVKVKVLRRFGIPCWNQYVIQVVIKWG